MPVAAPANLPQLTSFRFLAAVWVVLFHYWPDLVPATSSQTVLKGYLGVELFFTLSGFILAHVYLTSFGEGRFRYGSFLWARLARIYPLHLATLAGVGLLAAVAMLLGARIEHEVAKMSALPANLFLVQAWGVTDGAAWNHPSWSISAEWFAYLTFPVFAAVAWRLRERPTLAVTGALLLLFALYEVFPRLAGFPLTQATVSWGALRIVPCFAYGCALNLAFRADAVPSRTVAGWAALLFAATLGMAVEAGAPDAVTVAAGGGLILALAGMAQHGAKTLAQPWLVYLGEVSFALYMVCIPWRLAVGGLAQRFVSLPDGVGWPLWLWGAMALGVVPVAMAGHHLVERPARVLMRRLAELRPVRPREELRDETSRNAA